MFSLQNHIKAGKPTMDLAGNQSSLANLSSGKFHQAEKHFIFWAQIPHLELMEVECPPSSKALPEPPAGLGSPPHGEPHPAQAWLGWEMSLWTNPTDGSHSAYWVPTRCRAHGQRDFGEPSHHVRVLKNDSMLSSCWKAAPNVCQSFLFLKRSQKGCPVTGWECILQGIVGNTQ